MLMMIEGAETYELPEFLTDHMQAIWRNKSRILKQDEERLNAIGFNSVDTIYVNLHNAVDEYYLCITEDGDKAMTVVTAIEVVTEDTAIQNDYEYINATHDPEHQLAHYKVGETYSNYLYLGKSFVGEKLYFKDLG